MVHLDYRDARPIYAQLVDGFREQILAGVLQEGDKLPSVRELAGQLAINPNTIQRAYRELELSGWVASVAGKGSFVCPVPDAGETKALLQGLEKTVKALQARGMGVQDIIRYLEEGGKENAGNS